MRRVLSCVLLVACSAPTVQSQTPALPRQVDPSGSAAASAGPGSAAAPSASEVSLEQLAPGQAVRGFSAQAVFMAWYDAVRWSDEIIGKM